MKVDLDVDRGTALFGFWLRAFVVFLFLPVVFVFFVV